MSVTPLQLAHAYATVAASGVSRPISFLRVETAPEGTRALDTNVSRMLIQLLEAVVAPEGGGKLAAIPGYTVAGKTGTAWKATRVVTLPIVISRCSRHRPGQQSAPRRGGGHRRARRRQLRGEVSAPVFSGVVGVRYAAGRAAGCAGHR